MVAGGEEVSEVDNNSDASALAIPAAGVGADRDSDEDTGTTTYGSSEDLLSGTTALLQTDLKRWGQPKKQSVTSALSPVLSCVLANCSVPYLQCLSSMACSQVFDCLQSSGAPVASCAQFHGRMGPRDKRVFDELAECEAREHCFGPDN